MVLHAPQTLRALVRTDEIWLVVLSAFVGCGAGILVWLMTEATQQVHQLLFHIAANQRLSAMVELSPIRTLAVPTLGGLVLGLIGLAVVHFQPRRAVDPIEANALYGGRMSLNDSLVVVLQTICRTASARRSGWRRATRRSAPPPPPASAACSACAATISACWSAAAPPAPLPARSTRR